MGRKWWRDRWKKGSHFFSIRTSNNNSSFNVSVNILVELENNTVHFETKKIERRRGRKSLRRWEKNEQIEREKALFAERIRKLRKPKLDQLYLLILFLLTYRPISLTFEFFRGLEVFWKKQHIQCTEVELSDELWWINRKEWIEGKKKNEGNKRKRTEKDIWH